MSITEAKDLISEKLNWSVQDERGLEELVNSLIERKVISPSIAKKYFGYTAA